MTRIFSLIALIGVLACSSEGSEPPSPLESARGTLPVKDWPGKLTPTRETAQVVLDRIASLYQDYAAAAEPQGTRRVVGIIKDDDPFPHTNANFGENWEIQVTPAWLTYSTMTLDILALTSCHEMGHFVAGFPFKKTPLRAGTVSAAEGQADYFATKDCLPRLWASEPESNAAAFAELDSSQRALCTRGHGDRAGQALCGRILLTALQAAQILHRDYVRDHPSSNPADDPRLDTPDPTIVSETDTGRTDGQCRLDTMVAGIQCAVKAVGPTVPGLLPPYGKFSDASQEAARPFACQEGAGARPKCWFYPDTHEFDCTTFGPPRCDVADGTLGVRRCDSLTGPTFDSCNVNDQCLVDESGNPSCVMVDE